jgi:hypothetical protein
MRLFKRKNVDLGGPPPPMDLDGLLKRHQRDDCCSAALKTGPNARGCLAGRGLAQQLHYHMDVGS